MDKTLLTIIIGIVAEFFFMLRFLYQWIVSEKKKESTIDVYFWYISLVGAFFLLTYSALREDIVFILGQAINIFIYSRNIVLLFKHNEVKVKNLKLWSRFWYFMWFVSIAVLIGAVVNYFASNKSLDQNKLHVVEIWGTIGQLTFNGRFIVQWLYSEFKQRSRVPVALWYLSLVGSLMLLAYAIIQKDPIFILGQSTGSFVYIRNLMLIYKKKKRDEEEKKQK